MRNSSGGENSTVENLAVENLAVVEVGLVDPHPVHDDGELTGEGDLCAAHADTLGEGQAPAFESARAAIALQEDGSGLEKIGPHQPIAATGDMPGDVDLARLESSGREAEIGADRGRMLEPGGIVDDGGVGQSDDDADPGNGHETSRDGIGLGAGHDLAIEDGGLFAQRLPGGKERIDDRHDDVVALAGLANTDGEEAFGSAGNDDAEGFHEAANIVGDGLTLTDDLRSGDEQHAQLLSVHD